MNEVSRVCVFTCTRTLIYMHCWI